MRNLLYLSVLLLGGVNSIYGQGNVILTPTQEIIQYDEDSSIFLIDFPDTMTNTLSGSGTFALKRSFLVTGGYVTGSNLNVGSGGSDENYAVFHTTTSNTEQTKTDNVLFTVGQASANSEAYGNLRFTYNDQDSVVSFPQPILIERNNLVSVKYEFTGSNAVYRDLRIVLFGKPITEEGANGTDGDYFVHVEPEVFSISGPVQTLPPSLVLKHIIPNYAVPSTGTTSVRVSVPAQSSVISSASILSGPKQTQRGLETMIRIIPKTDGLATGQYSDQVTVIVTNNGADLSTVQEVSVPVLMTLNSSLPGTLQGWMIY